MYIQHTTHNEHTFISFIHTVLVHTYSKISIPTYNTNIGSARGKLNSEQYLLPAKF